MTTVAYSATPAKLTRRKPNKFELEFCVIIVDSGENSRKKVQNVGVVSTANTRRTEAAWNVSKRVSLEIVTEVRTRKSR